MVLTERSELTTFQKLQLQPWVTWPHPDTYKNYKTLKECIGEDEYGEAWVEVSIGLGWISLRRMDAHNIDTLSRQKKRKSTYPRSPLFPNSSRLASNGASSSRSHNNYQSQSGLSNATSVKSFATALTRQGTSSTAPSTAARRNEYDLGLTTLEISYFVTAFGQAEKQLGIVHQRNGEAYLPESVEGLKMRAMMIVKSVQDQNTARQDRMKSKIQKRNAHWQHAMAKAAGLRKEVSHVWTGLNPVDAEKRWLRNRCV